METLNNDLQSCTNPEIIASRLTSMRNIYFREELRTISNQIQEQYKERLPALHLVSIAAYEQVFQRQPLAVPEELRRDAVKYGLKYYQLNIEKLRIAEAHNGLYPYHDKLSCSDKNCLLHKSNPITSKHSLSKDNQLDENQTKSSDSHRSISSKTTSKSEPNSNRSSLTSDNTLDSTTTGINSPSTSVSSYNSSTTSITGHNLSSPLTFSDTSSIDSFSENKSNRSMATSTSTKKLSRTETPTILISRASTDSSTSNDTKNSSIIADDDQTSLDIHRQSSQKRKSKNKKRNKNTLKP